MLSAFSPFGMLEFSSKPPRAQSIYESLVSMHGGNFDDNFSGPLNAEWYAHAMAIGAARDTLERAENQADPDTVHEMLPVQESMYGLAPGPYDSADTRRATLKSRYLLMQRPTIPVVTQVLRLLCGDDFLAWVPNTSADPSPATIPTLECQDVTVRRKVLTLLDPAVAVGVPELVRYEHQFDDTTPLLAGETVVLDPGKRGIEELVTVQASYWDDTPDTREKPLIRIVVTRPHEAGAFGVSGSFPNWSSYRSNQLIVVKHGRATDPILRAKIDMQLTRMFGGTCTWDIVEESETPGVAGPFKVGESGIGIVPLGTITYVTP
jgi:hypothetical protein